MTWWRGWGPLALLPPAVLLFAPSSWPRWAVMWSLTVTIYFGCKWVTWRRTPVRDVPAWRHVGYLFAWPGLDAAAFLNPRPMPPVPRPTAREWMAASSKTALGVALTFEGARRVPAQYPYLVGWAGLIGMVFIAHFGIFHLLSCGWRRLGVDARPLMMSPLLSTSLSEFWGRRWNIAFRDLTHRFLFRPLTARLGVRQALLAGFLFSGLLHDLVISVPAVGGYGGPTLFFAIQGSAMLLERSTFGRHVGLGAGLSGWLFTMLVVVPPAYLLFHPPFVGAVVVPFLRAMRAI